MMGVEVEPARTPVEQAGLGAARIFVWLTTAIVFCQALLVCIWPPVLTDPDEALFAAIAREMLGSGDYLTPQYEGVPFLDRPAGYYWLLAASVFALGDHDLAYRAVSLVLGAMTTIAVGLIGRELFGREAGFAAAFAMSSTVASAVIHIMVGHDVLLVCCSTLAVWTGILTLKTSSPRLALLWALTTGVLMGIGCLAKGLLGIVIPWLALAPLRWRTGCPVRVGLIAAQLVAALAIAGPWYVAAELSNPGYLYQFLIERHLLGFLTNTQRHGGESLAVYLATLLIGGVPWVVMLIPRPWGGRARTSGNRSRDLSSWRIWFWLGSVLLFFGAARSRNPVYIAPAFVPLAILAGKRLADAIRDSKRRTAPLLVGQTVLSLVLLAAVLIHVFPRIANWRSACAVAHVLRMQPELPQPVLWFNRIPPSARLYAPEIVFRRVYLWDIDRLPPGEPTVLVSRESRLVEILPLPLTRGATELDVGKYHVFLCGPLGQAKAARSAGTIRLSDHAATQSNRPTPTNTGRTSSPIASVPSQNRIGLPSDQAVPDQSGGLGRIREAILRHIVRTGRR
jgi:4-amino-4-deoxy-L-arabinose transferase-like glycosyltransferase